MFRADLHCHSIFSDGSLSPKQLVDLAVSRELSGLSLTDHDTFEGFSNGKDYAKLKGIKWLPGIEMSTEHEGRNVHLLGYAFNPENTSFLELSTYLKNSRMIRNRGVLKLLEGIGIHIHEEELLKYGAHGSIGRPHIAKLLVEKKYVKSIEGAFKKYLGDGKPAFFKHKKVELLDGIKAIQSAGGYAVLAHPHLIMDVNFADRLLHLPLDGIEGYYSRMPLEKEMYWIEAAAKRSLFVTGGSDFHGEPKPDINLGISWVQEDVFNLLWDRWKKNEKAPT